MTHKSVLISVLLCCLTPGFAAEKTLTSTTSKIDPSQLLCPDAKLWGNKLITGICWSCLFPIRLLGMTVMEDAQDLPDGVADKSFCACSTSSGLPSPGITGGAWLPSRLIEVVRQPYCSPALGGIKFNRSVRLWGGSKETGELTDDKTYYNIHQLAFPLYALLQLFVQTNCNGGLTRNMDMLFMSELDPTWNVDELAFFMNPEVALFANPLAMAACTVDCATTTVHKPLKSLFWCAGCWGNLYPFSGNIASDASAPRDTSLLAARMLAKMHRTALARKTYGNEALCSGTIYPMIPKQQYKFSTLFPISEASSETREVSETGPDGVVRTVEKIVPGNNCCHYLGESPFTWGEHRTIPGVGEDYLYLVWRYTDCCLTADK